MKLKVTALIVVSIFIIFDIATGWLKALSTGTADSSVMRKGLYHKLAEIMSVLFGYICEYVFPYAGIDVTIPFATAIGTYIVLMETASIVENLAIMNPHLAQILSKFFTDDKITNLESEGKHLENQPSDSCGSSDGKMG